MRYLFIIIILSVAFLGIAQGDYERESLKKLEETDADSTKIKIYNDLFLYFEFRDTLKAKNYLLTSLQLAKDSEYKPGLSDVYLYFGYYYEDQSDYNSALNFYISALEIAEEINDKLRIASANNNVGNSYLRKSSYPEALKAYQTALIIAEDLQNKNLISKFNTNIGSVHLYMHNHEKAIEHYSTSMEIADELGDKKRMADCLNNLGLIYGRQEKFVEAIDNYEKALEVLTAMDDKHGMANAYANLGLIYATEKDSTITNFDKANESYQKALDYYTERNDKKGLSICLNNIAILYSKQEKYGDGVKYSIRSMEIAEEINSIDDLRNSYKTLSDNYRGLKDYENAYEYHVKYKKMSDTIQSEKNIEEITRMELQYEFDKKQKDQEFEKYKQDQELKAQKEINRVQKNVNNVLIIGAALLLVLVFIAFRSYRIKRRDNRLLDLQKQEIVEKNEELNQQNEEIAAQRDEIESKNKDITDSIKYAKRIQEAILPPDSVIKQHLPSSFVFYKPKDIVSGDFYWINKKDNKILFAAVDCTGHGVPGAIISIVGHNGLNRAVNEFGLTKPSDILDSLNIMVNETLRQKLDESTIRDGMDIALCSLDLVEMRLEYSGAYNPLIIIRDKELLEYKGDKQPVGQFIEENPDHFTNHEIKIEKGDSLYIFSDGFADQFGGPEGKKLKLTNFKKLLMQVAEKPIQEQSMHLDIALEEWIGRERQLDDICIFGVSIT